LPVAVVCAATVAGVLAAAPAAVADPVAVPPNLSNTFIIENAGQPGALLCATPDSSSILTLPLSLDINAYCLWQQSGSDGDAVLYNPAKGLVLDINSSGPLNDGTPVNLQPYYTNPLQSYEEWTWSGDTGFGGVALRPHNNTDLNLNGQSLNVTGWNGNQSNMTWRKVFVTADSHPPVTMPTNPNPPPNLSADMLVQNAGYPWAVMCASATDSGVSLQPLSQSINPLCLWQQGGPSNGAPSGAYLYNPAKDAVLDINSSGPLNDGTPVNLQPYYTNPLQSYEWWNLSGQTGFGGQAIRPANNTDLNLRANGPSAPLTINSWNGNQAAMTWTTAPVADTSAGSTATVAIQYGDDSSKYLCQSPDGAHPGVYLSGPISNVSCLWSQVTEPGGAFAFKNTWSGQWLTYQGKDPSPVVPNPPVTVAGGANPTTMQWWTLGGMESSGAQAIRPYTDITENIDGHGCLLGTCINTTTWGSGPASLTWRIVRR
jgi:hypothetical protein